MRNPDITLWFEILNIPGTERTAEEAERAHNPNHHLNVSAVYDHLFASRHFH